MGLFGKQEKSKTEEILKQRDEIKLDMATKLYKKGFSDDQVERVLSVIETAERDIQEIKDSLIGTNINPKGDPMEPLYKGKEEIRKRQLEMQQELVEIIQKFTIENSKLS